MSRVFVTGAAGFLGSHLVDRLLEEGDTVVAIDDLSSGRLRNLANAHRSGRFKFIQADIAGSSSGKDTLLRVLARSDGDRDVGTDRIFHLASPASPRDYLGRPIETLRTGSEGTRRVLELARRTDATFLLTSTSEVYGDPEVSPQPEAYWGNVNPVGPRSVYDEAKRYAEALTSAYQRTYGLKVRIARIFNTYGPGMRREDGRVVSTFIRQALDGEPLTVYGDGSQTRSFCYVDDMVRGLRLLMEKGDHAPTNIGNPEEVPVLDLARMVLRLTGSSSTVRFDPLPEDDPKRRRPDIGRAERLLGWRPEVPLEEGLARTIAYERELLEDTVTA